MLQIAIAQITGRAFAPQDNRNRCVEAAEQASRDGAKLIVLPELIVPGYALDGEGMSSVAEPLDGPTLESWIQICRARSIYMAGGIAEKAGHRLFNTAILVGPNGLILHYRKLHPFDAEKTIFTPGDLGLPVAKTEIGNIGLCVCYDLRFIEVVRALSLQGADLILVPTAWVAGFDQNKWDDEGYCPQARGVLLQANLNQVFIACASHAGSNGTVDFLGSSVIAGPYGKVAAGPLPSDDEEIAITEIDMADAERARERSEFIRPRADRRRDVYGIALGDRVL